MRRRSIPAATLSLISLSLLVSCGARVARAEQPSDARHVAFGRLVSHRPNVASPAPAPLATDVASLLRCGRAQAVRFDVPPGAMLELATSAGIIAVDPSMKLALAVGSTYRLRVVYRTEKLDLVLYPTIRLIGYTVPPAHVDPVEFPVPVRFDSRDLEDAADGRHVSNVIYLEDPTMALPVSFPRGDMPVLDLSPGEDVLFKASVLGRPIVFIQLGDRVMLDDRFEVLRNDPPAIVLPAAMSPATVGAIGVVPPARAFSGDEFATGVRTAGWNGTPAGAAAAAACSHGSPSCSLCCNKSNTIRQPYKVHPRMPFDEYVCDGGDQVPHVHFDSSAVLTGLAAGETVGQFSRPGDRPRVSTANQVCVYAPRFGLLRSSLASLARFQIEGARGVAREQRRAAMENRIAADQQTENKQVRGLRQRSRPSSMLTRENVAGLEELRVLDAVHQRDGSDNVFGRTGAIKMSQTNELRLKTSIDAARVWNRELYPAFTALTEGGGQVTGYARTGEIEKFDEANRRPGELVLTKVATPQHAQQGDVVEFAIYYHNVGERPIEGISIIDSLTARLEYVPNSAQTDRRAVFTARPNDVDSHEIRWDISDPLPGGQTGVVWFQAKVR